MLTKFVEQDRRQKLRSDIAPRRGIERRRRLRDRLAVPTAELLPHRVDHLEATWDLFQRRGHAFAELRQPRGPAAGTLRRSRQDHAFSQDVVGEGLANGPPALKRTHRLRLARRLLGGEFILSCSRLKLLKL